MQVIITLLNEVDVEELYQFEVHNRVFFEKMVPSRGEDYYHVETFKVRHKELLLEQEKGLSRFYLIRKVSGEIIGRLNLVDIDSKECTASVGFRVGEQFVGKGIAYQALKLLLKTELSIKKIHGKTTTNNIASQKVMEKSGFNKVSTSDEDFHFNGEKVKFLHYLWQR